MGKIKQYEEEFKRQSVKHIFQTGKAVAQVARELGVTVNTLHSWVKKYKQEPKVIKKRTFRSEDQQTKEMEQRIRDLEEENAILKRQCTSSRKTIGKILIYPSKPLHIPSGEDVPSSTCIPKRILQMEKSNGKSQASRKRTNHSRYKLYFFRITLFIWKS
ncbi:transposase [Bacillus cereus]